MAATFPFCEALNKGIISGTLVDTKVVLFSHRDSSGRVFGAKPLYASSHVLKSVPYFNDLLFGNFSEAELRDFNERIDDRESTADDYGYDSDSDLEVDDDEKPTLPTTACDESSAGPSMSSKRQVAEESYYETHSELSDKGKIIRLPDMAYITFQAFIFYLYTGKIEFASLGSQEDQASRVSEVRTSSNDAVPRPSSKSVYRLADKYDVPTLKNLAFDHIRNELKKCDIVEETFSEFTSRYDDIKMACVTQLVSALRNDTPEKATWAKLCEIIDGRFKEDLGFAKETIALLWKTINQGDGTSTTMTPNNLPPPAPIDEDMSRDALQAAIVKSIREGAFFDRKYWVRCWKSSGVLKAVYFSSVIAGDKLGTCVARSNGKGTPTKDSAGETDAESDRESYTIETEVSTKNGNGDTRAVLSPGTYSSWKSVFFYMCTGQTSFSPLRSQRIGSHPRDTHGKTISGSPPCSPKSIYIIANLLKIQALCDLALKDIESKLSEDNIAEEFFSCITAGEQHIVEMECRMLFSKFYNAATISRIQEKIRGLPGNHLAHCAGALKLGLRTALDLRKPDPQAGEKEGVMLQCGSGGCPGSKEDMPYSLVGSRTACPRCNYYAMVCLGCRSARMHVVDRCQFCKKKFL